MRKELRRDDASCLPAVLAEQRNESHGGDVFAVEIPAFLREEMQHLLVAIAERDQEPAVVRELLDVCVGHRRRSGANEDRIKRSKPAPAESSVAEHEGNVVRAHLIK